MKSFLSALIIIMISSYAPAQESTKNSANKPDTTKSVIDSLSSIPDTLKGNPTALDTIIYASSKDSLIFFVNRKKMNLYGDGQVKYQTTDLKSENISVDFNTNTLDATGKANDTTKGKQKGTPVLNEGGEEYTGNTIRYNFKTAQGIISEAGTSSEGAYYTGEKIKKVNVSTYFIKDGIYTTCDHNPPHYYFYSPEMKVIQKKEIAAKWIWLYFGGVPFPIPLPFGVFPLQTGRRSGIIAPVIGYDARYGNYLSHMGYFWAINDYMDLNLTADYYTRGSFGLSSRFRYVKRYDYSGSFQAGYKIFKLHESTDPDASVEKDWSLSWSHHQNFTPTLRMDANLQFLSNNFLKRTSIDPNQYLENTIVSNATIGKSWESGNSMSISYNRTQKLKSGDIFQILPSITFTKTQDYPFRSDVGSSSDRKWYELFVYNYRGEYQNQRNKTSGVVTSKQGMLHTISGSMSPKFGYINISPNFTYQERWYDKSIERIDLGPGSDGTDSVVSKDVNGLNFVRTFNLGVSASTKMYGIFNPHILGIASIRHTLLPSISYNYQPDFSKAGWGYYGTYVDSKGNEVRYDKFEGSVYGGAPTGEQQSINFSLGNIFEMKTEVDPTDTTSKEKKIQLLNLSANIGYNFVADSLKFSDLSLGYRTQIGDKLSIQGNSNFSLYDYDKTTGNKINSFLINEGKGLVRLTSFSFSLSTHLAGERTTSSDETAKTDSSIQKGEFELVQESNALSRGIYNNSEADFSIPWDISLNYNYSFSKLNPLKPYKSSNVSANLNFNLTKSWKVSFTGSYDFEMSKFVAPQIRISRDLHAWIMNFTWNPIGIYSGYMLEIRVKAPQLSDLKVTKRDQFFNGR